MTDRKKRRLKRQAKNYRRRMAKRTSLLCSAAAIMSSLAAPALEAQTFPEQNTFRFQYYYYEDWQEGGEDRISVQSPMAWYNGAITESTELEAGFVYDSVSGASALFLDSLTGASGWGIQDDRHAGDITVTEHFDSFKIGVGAQYSSEEDYDAVGGNVVSSFWTEDRNTTFTFGASFSHDEVRSNNAPDLAERKETTSVLAGVTQVIDANSYIQTNFTYAHDSGFLSDPYKPLDTRFENKDSFALLSRYRRYIEEFEAALHVDYRFYFDSWEVVSHMLEAKWYQPLDEGGTWMLRPRLRYYTQSKAEFYSDEFPSDDPLGTPYSTDYRLRSFGNITTGLKLIHTLSDDLALQLSGDFIVNSSDLAVFSSGSPGIDDLYAVFFGAGIEYKFD